MEKGGLAAGLTAAGVRAGEQVAWADELRLGLRGQVRRVWAPWGVKVRQVVEVVYAWRYLALAVDGCAGRLWWAWLPNMPQGPLLPVVRGWWEAGIAALVWDGAPSHRAKRVRGVGIKLVPLPPYSPELNPAERVFEEVRRAVEGRRYGTIEAKMAAVERELAELAADPAQVRSLAGWSWVQEAVQCLST